MVLLDGLDLPLAHALDAVFFEEYPEERQPVTKPVDESRRKYAVPALLPTYESHLGAHSPLLNYTWERTRVALGDLLAQGDPNPQHGHLLEYVNPRTGGPVMPTMGCHVRALPPAFTTEAYRQSASAVYQVVEGEGTAQIGDQRFDFQPKDVFCVPSWLPCQLTNASHSTPAYLFSFTDAPVLRAVGLYREGT